MSQRLPIEPEWLLAETVRLLHRRQLSEHGGADGVRDQAMLDSALHRPLNQWSYADPDLFDLAAANTFGISRNHPFVDGNKRTAWVACRLFLKVNGLDIVASQEDKYVRMLGLAAGDIAEEDFAAWLRASSIPR